MKLNALRAAALFLGLVQAAVEEWTDSDFRQNVARTQGEGAKPALVKFYAPWCGHCKSMAPAYEAVGEATDAGVDFIVAKVDASAHRTVASDVGLKGFPTLKVFLDGKMYDFRGARQTSSMLEFVRGGFRKTGIDAEEMPEERSWWEHFVADLKAAADLFVQVMYRAPHVVPVALSVGLVIGVIMGRYMLPATDPRVTRALAERKTRINQLVQQLGAAQVQLDEARAAAVANHSSSSTSSNDGTESADSNDDQ